MRDHYASAILLIILLTGSGCTAASNPSSNALDARIEELRTFRSGTLAAFLQDPARRESFSSAEILCLTADSDLPKPFKGSRRGKEYYALISKHGRYAWAEVLFEVRGRYEDGRYVLEGSVPRESPFWIALHTGRGAEHIVILRMVVGRAPLSA